MNPEGDNDVFSGRGAEEYTRMLARATAAWEANQEHRMRSKGKIRDISFGIITRCFDIKFRTKRRAFEYLESARWHSD